jgi:hypothetical protein
MSMATTVPQRSQGMSLLSITSLVSGGRGGRSTEPARSGVLPIAASIRRVNSSPKGLKIAVRCVVIGSDWVGWITNYFAGNMAAPIIQFL